MTTRENPLLQPSKSGGSEPLSVTVPHPVLGLRDKLERISRTGVVTEAMYLSSHGEALAAALLRCVQSVDRKVGDRPRSATYYYVTYEVVVDDDGGPGGPMRPPVAGEAAGVVLGGMQRSERQEAAA